MSFGKTVVCFGAKITHLIFSFVFCCSLSLFSQNLSDARMSLIITDITSDATIADIDSRTPMTPASITKLITTATALELLGENFRFATEIFIDGNISDSTLHGNLIVRAVGDPTIGSSYFYRVGAMLYADTHLPVSRVSREISLPTSLYSIPLLFLRGGVVPILATTMQPVSMDSLSTTILLP